MKFIKIASISTIVVLTLAVLGVSLAFAQNPTPTSDPSSWWNNMGNMMRGSGMMGNGGGMMGGNGQSMQEMHNQITQSGGMGAMHEWMLQSGGMHETVWNAMAEQLGLTSDELTAETNSGKTLAQIAQEKGISTKDLAVTMGTSMQAGLVQAVKDGKLTQEQADLMLQQMDGQYEWMINNMGAGMMGTGAMGNGGGMMGRGSGGCHNTGLNTDNSSSY